MVFGRRVVVEYRKRDRYGRIVGRVFVGDVDISALGSGGGSGCTRRVVQDLSEPLRVPVEVGGHAVVAAPSPAG